MKIRNSNIHCYFAKDHFFHKVVWIGTPNQKGHVRRKPKSKI